MIPAVLVSLEQSVRSVECFSAAVCATVAQFLSSGMA